MSDTIALATKLAALAAEDDVFVSGARVISREGAPAPMVAILGEVDNTVLERTLVFSIDDIDVHLVVAGRRLRGLIELTGDVPGMEDVIGEVLSRDEDETLQAMGAILNHLCAAATKVTVRHMPVRPLGSSAEAGLPASVLAGVWKVDLDAVPAPPLARFLTANADVMSGRVYMVGGQVSDTTGETVALQAILDDQLDAFRDRHKTLFGKQDDPMLICLDGALGGSGAAAIAIVGDEVCAFAYDPDKIGQLMASWHVITA